MNISHLEKMFQMTAMEQMFNMIQTMKKQMEEPVIQLDPKIVVKVEDEEKEKNTKTIFDLEQFKDFVKTQFEETNERISKLSNQMTEVMLTIKHMASQSENIRLHISEKTVSIVPYKSNEEELNEEEEELNEEEEELNEEEEGSEENLGSTDDDDDDENEGSEGNQGSPEEQIIECITNICNLSDSNTTSKQISKQEREQAITVSKTISSTLVELADILQNIDKPQIEDDTSKEIDELVVKTINMSLYDKEEEEEESDDELKEEADEELEESLGSPEEEELEEEGLEGNQGSPEEEGSEGNQGSPEEEGLEGNLGSPEEEELEGNLGSPEEDELEEEPDDELEGNLGSPEEELFEIEIDDVTYFATSEDNGLLYSVDVEGEIGDLVGMIKDGEPIFHNKE